MPAESAQSVGEFLSDGADVSVRHFGAIVDERTWDQLVERLTEYGTRFSMPPQVIRAGTVEEQKIVMMPDGCGNIVELKSISADRVFAS